MPARLAVQNTTLSQHRRVLSTLLCMFALLVPVPNVAAQGDDARIERSTRDLERVRMRLRALSKRIESDSSRQDAVAKALQNSEQRISELLASLSRLSRQIEDQRAAVSQTEAERDDAAKRADAQRAVLAEQVRAAYQIGRQGRTKLLLNQEDPVAVGRVLTYYDYVAKARSERIKGFIALIERLNALEADLADKLAALSRLRDQREESLDKVEQTRALREAALTRLEERIRDGREEVRQLKADEARLTDLLESLQDLLADIPLDLGDNLPFAKRRGSLDWPLRGRVLAAFGSPKAGSLRWKGLWIGADAGAPVEAVAPGRVAYVGWMHRYGLLVILEHGDNFYTLYGHNQTAYKQVGEWVRGGEKLAEAGNSGGHRNTGVYFELRQGKRAVDPISWLGKR